MTAATATRAMPTAAPASGRRRRLPERAHRGHQVAFVLLLLAGWEVLVRGGLFDRRFVAPPSGVAVGFGQLVRDTEVLLSLRETGTAVAYAVALASIVGVTVGFAVGLSPFFARSFLPVINTLFAWPKTVMTPFFILIFGFGLSSKAVFAATLGVFPVLFNAAEGARSAPDGLRRAAVSMGASRLQVLRHIVVPASTPSLMCGLRLGVNYCLLGVILAELYGATNGVGVHIEHFTLRLQRDLLFALFFLVSLIAVLVNGALAYAERRLQSWRA